MPLLGHSIAKAFAEQNCQRAKVLGVENLQHTEPNGFQGWGSG